MYKKGKKFLALFLSMLFLFAGCGGENKSYEQLCDINTGLEPKLSGLQESGEKNTRHMLIRDYESFQSVRDELQTKNAVELPKIKKDTFDNSTIILMVHTVPQSKKYEYRVKEISVNRKTLTVISELVEDREVGGDDQVCYRVVLVRLDKKLVQDVQKVSVKTERVDEKF